MTREQQVLMFRLRTGHCGLLAHLYRIGRSHTDQCPCGTGVQDVDHLLQTCPTYKDLRQAYWPEEVDLSTKLWGPPEALLTTTGYTAATKLHIYYDKPRIAEEEEENHLQMWTRALRKQG